MGTCRDGGLSFVLLELAHWLPDNPVGSVQSTQDRDFPLPPECAHCLPDNPMAQCSPLRTGTNSYTE